MQSTKYRKLQSKVCPSLGHCVPTAWALTPQALGIGAPRLEHVLINCFLDLS